MDHLKQTTLIRAVAGELDAEDRAAVERHLADCEHCRTRYEAQVAVWTALGEWQPTWAERDLSAGIERKLAATARPSHRLRLSLPAVGRVAAAVLVGVGIGYLAARSHVLTTTERVSDTVATAADTMTGPAVQLLDSPSPVGLYGALLAVAGEEVGR